MSRQPQFFGERRLAEVRPVEKQEIRLGPGPIFLEERENRLIGWTGANVFFGLPTPITDIAVSLHMDLQGRKDFQGFTHLYRYPLGTTIEQAEAWEMQATTTLMKYLLEKSGIAPEQIGYVGFGCGSPIGDFYLEQLIDQSGIIFSPDTHYSEVSTACNSGSRILAKMGEQVQVTPNLQDKYAMLIALEGLGRFLLQDGNVPLTQLGDLYSLMIFGNGLGGMIFPIGSMQILSNTTKSLRDERGNLAGIMTYKVYPQGDLVQTINGKERIMIPPTSDGYKLFMRPNDVAKMFLGFARQVAPQFDPSIKVISAHQMSNQMLEGLRRGLGVDNKLVPSVVVEGNMIGATETIARNRLMENFRRGDTVAFLGVGAGMQGSFVKAKIL